MQDVRRAPAMLRAFKTLLFLSPDQFAENQEQLKYLPLIIVYSEFYTPRHFSKEKEQMLIDEYGIHTYIY